MIDISGTWTKRRASDLIVKFVFFSFSFFRILRAMNFTRYFTEAQVESNRYGIIIHESHLSQHKGY